MIDGHEKFASLKYPANWEPPIFQLGDKVWYDGCECLIVGMEYVTEETAPTHCDAALGWWCFVAYTRQHSKRVITDVIGHHESVIQPLSPTAHPVIQGARCVSH